MLVFSQIFTDLSLSLLTSKGGKGYQALKADKGIMNFIS